MDLIAEIVRMLDTVPNRLIEDTNAETVSEAGEIMEVFALCDMPENREKLRNVQGALIHAFMRSLQKTEGRQFEMYRSTLFSCTKCHTTPVIVFVKKEKPAVIDMKCPNCTYEQQNSLTDEELVELRSLSIPLDSLGRKLKSVKTTRKKVFAD